MWYRRSDIYKGFEGEKLKKVLPLLTREDRKKKLPAVIFDIYLDNSRNYTQEQLLETAHFDTNLKIAAKMGNILEALAEKFFETGAYGADSGDGLVGFELFPRLKDSLCVRPEIGRLTYTKKGLYGFDVESHLWDLRATGINNPNKLQEIKKFCVYGDYECNTKGEVAFGEPSWWIEMVRRIIVSEPYVATDGRDYQSTAFYDDPRTKQRSCASLKRDKPKFGLAEKFNRDIFLHGECWRFAHMFSLMVRKPTIPVWFEYADGGDHILTLCDGWFWDCEGHYLLEDLEEKGWFVSTIVNDPNIQGRSNLYRFTRIQDCAAKEDE